MSGQGRHPDACPKAAGNKTGNAYGKVQFRPMQPVAAAVDSNQFDLRWGDVSEPLNHAYRNLD